MGTLSPELPGKREALINRHRPMQKPSPCARKRAFDCRYHARTCHREATDLRRLKSCSRETYWEGQDDLHRPAL